MQAIYLIKTKILQKRIDNAESKCYSKLAVTQETEKGGAELFNKNEFKAQIVRAGKSAKEVAEYLGINESTLYRKVQADGNFSREEINKLIVFLNIEHPQAIFFAE